MKTLFYNIIILCLTLNCFGQVNKDTNRVILSKEGIWSDESKIDSHTRCKSELADSLALLSNKIMVDSLSSEIDSNGLYIYQFYKKIDWKIDFKNLPVYAHECYGLDINEKIDVSSFILSRDKEYEFLWIAKYLNGREQEISSFHNGQELWLVIRVREITMLGNSQRGYDFEFYFKKNKTN